MKPKDETSTSSIRITHDLRQALQVQADKESRSFNRQVIHYLKQGLKADGVNTNGLVSMGSRNKK